MRALRRQPHVGARGAARAAGAGPRRRGGGRTRRCAWPAPSRSPTTPVRASLEPPAAARPRAAGRPRRAARARSRRAVAEAAARRRPRPDLGPAQAQLAAQYEAGLDVEAFEEADVRFHLALAVASGNRALELVMIAVRDSVASHLLDALRALPDPGRDARPAARRARGDPRRGRGARRRDRGRAHARPHPRAVPGGAAVSIAPAGLLDDLRGAGPVDTDPDVLEAYRRDHAAPGLLEVGTAGRARAAADHRRGPGRGARGRAPRRAGRPARRRLRAVGRRERDRRLPRRLARAHDLDPRGRRRGPHRDRAGRRRQRRPRPRRRRRAALVLARTPRAGSSRRSAATSPRTPAGCAA